MCTSRPYSSEFGDTIGGHCPARLDEYMEVVDGLLAGCWDSIIELVNFKPWQCDKVTFPLSTHGVGTAGGGSCTEAQQMLKLRSGLNLKSCQWREEIPSLADAVLGVYCTQCQLMIIACRDGEEWLNLVLWDDGWVVDEKERDGGWRWERCAGYEQIREIRSTTRLIGLRRPFVSVNRRWMGNRSWHIRDDKLTSTRNSLKSQFPMIIHPISFSILLSPQNTMVSHPSLSLHAMIKS